MTRDEYLELYERYLSGNAEPDEIETLFAYKDKFDIAQFDDEVMIPNQESIKTRIYAQIEQQISEPEQTRRFIGSRFWWSVAASLFFLSFATLYFVKNHAAKTQNKPVQIAKVVAPILPGTNKAILVLSNGGKIDLNQTANGRISQAGKVVITKLKNGKLQYEKNIIASDKDVEVTYNTIITPKGGQYQVVLPDGTSVCLNAASSLKYPTAFVGSERHVELNGEAYFEVTKNKNMPFTVSAGAVNVKVLGTHFDISAYDDDPSNKTTLLEGSVILTKGDQKVALVPGQQAVAEKTNSQIQLNTVNVADAVAWKNGYFSFRKENIKSSMRKIARWYDVDVDYQGEVSNKFLGGTVSRTQDIKELLSYMELTGIAHFKINERRIIVKGN
jgi:transmembrane sensor